ncbi:Hypothetical_protein [Hexamita inflata]|uniref:Hypothetical_protein n=1 Tax=Hexamita inflata TaxID=28002 RepID=A0AA86PIW1_9EUKA|nr:Hypothetical protein HINF_LOCUS26953 [Hexamita inflata]
MAPHGAGSDRNYCVNMTSCLAPHMNFWLKLPYLQPPNDLFPPQFCLLKLVQPIGILTYMNESSLRLDFTSLYLYSFRQLNSFPQLLLNLLLFRSKQLPCCFRVFVKLSLAFKLHLLGSKSVSSSFFVIVVVFVLLFAIEAVVHLTLFDVDVRILISCCSLFGRAVILLYNHYTKINYKLLKM